MALIQQNEIFCWQYEGVSSHMVFLVRLVILVQQFFFLASIQIFLSINKLFKETNNLHLLI